MRKSYEEISNFYANEPQKTDANVANDALHLGGIEAKDYALKSYVQEYHEEKETKLKEYINSQDKKKLEEAKQYMDTAIHNQNFSDFVRKENIQSLEQEINSLDEKYDSLFQSVSDGKLKIADAITDKGVETSATDTFENMANNIQKIESGGSGGEIPPGYIDTSDATAKSNDILLGKTAYCRGDKINGSLNPNVVEKIYETISGNFEIENSIKGYSNVDYNNKTYKATGVYGIDKSGKYIVRQLTTTDNDTRYIASNPIGDIEITIPSNRWLYSFSELNLNSSANVDYISLGNPGFMGNENQVALCIIQGKNIHFYRYSLTNGTIEIEENQVWHWTYYNSKYFYECRAVGANLNPNIFAIGMMSGGGISVNGTRYIGILSIKTNYNSATEKEEPIVEISLSNGGSASGVSETSYKYCSFSLNDNYVYADCESGYVKGLFSTSGFYCLYPIIKDMQGNYTIKDGIYCDIGNSNKYGTTSSITVLPNEKQVLLGGYLFDISNTENGIELINKSSVQYINKNGRYVGFSFNGKYCYIAGIGSSSSIFIYKVDNASLSEWNLVSEITMTENRNGDYDNFYFSQDMSLGLWSTNSTLFKWECKENQKTIKAIKYDGKYFLPMS